MEQGAQKVLNLVWDLEKEGKLRVIDADDELPVTSAPSGLATAQGPGDIDPLAPRTIDSDLK
jgi:hypothetical protein